MIIVESWSTQFFPVAKKACTTLSNPIVFRNWFCSSLSTHMGVPGKRCQGRGERATIPISYSDSPPLLPILILTLIFTFTRHLSPLTPQLSPITSHVSRLTSQRAMGENEVDGEDEGEGECVSSKVYKQLLAQACSSTYIHTPT